MLINWLLNQLVNLGTRTSVVVLLTSVAVAWLPLIDVKGQAPWEFQPRLCTRLHTGVIGSCIVTPMLLLPLMDVKSGTVVSVAVRARTPSKEQAWTE